MKRTLPLLLGLCFGCGERPQDADPSILSKVQDFAIQENETTLPGAGKAILVSLR